MRKSASTTRRPTKPDAPGTASASNHDAYPHAWIRLAPAKPTSLFDSYWDFAAKRQDLFFAQVGGNFNIPTDDLVLATYKFTNAYRASDRVSQYLIRNVIYEGDQSTDEVFFRILVFKLFNRVDTWRLLQKEIGEISYDTYSFKRYDSVLGRARGQHQQIYSGAYIMPSGKTSFGSKIKYRNHLRLLEKLMSQAIPQRIADCRSMQEAFEILRSFPMLGNFLAYQYLIDLNYSTITDFSEGEYIVPGPGALSGIRKCFSSLGGLTEPELIRYIAERQEEEFRLRGIRFKTLWGRRLQLIDCQNLFCEIDKYSRVQFPNLDGGNGRTKIKQRYTPNQERIAYWYPPKWKIDTGLEPEMI